MIPPKAIVHFVENHGAFRARHQTFRQTMLIIPSQLSIVPAEEWKQLRKNTPYFTAEHLPVYDSGNPLIPYPNSPKNFHLQRSLIYEDPN